MGICRGHVSVGRRPSPRAAKGRWYSTFRLCQLVLLQIDQEDPDEEVVAQDHVLAVGERNASTVCRASSPGKVALGQRQWSRFHVGDALDAVCVPGCRDKAERGAPVVDHQDHVKVEAQLTVFTWSASIVKLICAGYHSSL